MRSGDPQERHAAALAAIDRQIEVALAAAVGGHGWEFVDTYADTDLGAVVQGDGAPVIAVGATTVAEARHIAENDPATVLAQLEGRRSILERHGPASNRLCETCRTNEYAVDSAWPCLDWLDAAAGLDVDCNRDVGR